MSKARSSTADSASEPTSEMDLPFIAQVQGSLPEQPISNQHEVLVISDEDDSVILILFIAAICGIKLTQFRHL